MPKGAELFERLELLERRAFQPRISTKEIGAIRIDSDVSVTRKPVRQVSRGNREGIPGPGHRRAAEISRQSGAIEDNFDCVGIEQLVKIPDWVTSRRHSRFRCICKESRHCTYQSRLDHRLIALDIDDQIIRCKPEALDHFRDPIGTRGVIAASHYCVMAVLFYGRCDVAVVGCYIHLVRAAFARPLGHPHDHGLAADVRERFPREPAGRITRRNDSGEGHAREREGLRPSLTR